MTNERDTRSVEEIWNEWIESIEADPNATKEPWHETMKSDPEYQIWLDNLDE